MLFSPSYQPLPFVLAAALGGILFDKLTATPAAFYPAIIFVIIVLWFFFRRRSQYIAALCLLLICFAVFALRHHDYYYRFAENDIGNFAKHEPYPAAVNGIVGEMPRYYPKPPDETGAVFESSDRTNLTLFVQQLRSGSGWLPVSGKISVTINGDLRHLRVGDTVQIFGRMRQPAQPQNPGDYNYADMLRGLRIRAVLFCTNENAVTVLKTGTGTLTAALKRLLETVRRQGLANLEHRLSPQTLPLAEGMIFGVRQSVDEELTQGLLETGTMHILAISGLHIALVGAITAFFLRLLNVSRKTAAVFIIICVFLYLFVTDVRTPAIRATALITFYGIAVLANRQTNFVNLLSATALLILLFQPTELFQFGAQMSFIAVGSFLWMPKKMTLSQIFNPMFFSVSEKALLELKKTENEEEYLMKKGRLIFYLLRRFAGAGWNLFLGSCTIWLITMPLILERFHLFTPVAVAVNPALWIPLTASMFFGFIAALCGQIPLIGSVSGSLADFSFWSLIGTVSFFQQLGGHYYLPGPPVWWNLVFYSVFCVFTFLPLQRPRRFVLFGLLAVWITVGFTSGYVRNYIRQSEDRLTLAVYAVGHGNGILITTPQNRLIVCDAGCIGRAKHAGNILSRAVWQSGKTHIDTIIVTHSDIDHFNGINRLLDMFSVGTVLISPYSEHPNSSQQDQSAWRELRKRLDTLRIPVRVIGSGDDLSQYGLPRSHILHPPKTGFAQPHKTNDCSIVLRFEHCGTSVMLTGDLDGSEPAAFLRTQPQHTDAVLVPHHGGKSGQTALLLDWATPQKLLVSAGSMTYRKEKMDDYRQRGFSVHNTYEGGAVILNITKDGWQ